MWNDVRLALRQLWASKGFTLTATITLALGIGANTGIFTLIHALLLKSLPVADPDRIAQMYLQLHRQHRSTWAFEVVLRPWNEKW